jgi:DNA-binding response OmpR family regulator
MKILVVEDEENIREVLKIYLLQAGFDIVEAGDGQIAWERIRSQKFDLILLDLNLPGIDGISLCKKVRELSNVPVIMLTARVEEAEELIGLEVGADDYIKKPFKPSLVIARIRALLRRMSGGILEVGSMQINPDKVEVYKEGSKVDLTATQFNILYILASSPGKVFTREELLDKAYNSTIAPDILDRTIDAHIKSIRKKLKKTQGVQNLF